MTQCSSLGKYSTLTVADKIRNLQSAHNLNNENIKVPSIPLLYGPDHVLKPYINITGNKDKLYRTWTFTCLCIPLHPRRNLPRHDWTISSASRHTAHQESISQGRDVSATSFRAVTRWRLTAVMEVGGHLGERWRGKYGVARAPRPCRWRMAGVSDTYVVFPWFFQQSVNVKCWRDVGREWFVLPIIVFFSFFLTIWR